MFGKKRHESMTLLNVSSEDSEDSEDQWFFTHRKRDVVIKTSQEVKLS